MVNSSYPGNIFRGINQYRYTIYLLILKYLLNLEVSTLYLYLSKIVDVVFIHLLE